MIAPLVEAWFVTLLAEVPCVAACYRGQHARMALTCALGTSFTNLAMNGLLPRWLGTGSTWLVTGEVAALALEGLLYLAVGRPRDPARAFIASAVANAASLGAGLLLFR